MIHISRQRASRRGLRSLHTVRRLHVPRCCQAPPACSKSFLPLPFISLLQSSTSQLQSSSQFHQHSTSTTSQFSGRPFSSLSNRTPPYRPANHPPTSQSPAPHIHSIPLSHHSTVRLIVEALSRPPTTLRAWSRLLSKVPKGFENFYPKGDKSDKAASDAEKSESQAKESRGEEEVNDAKLKSDGGGSGSGGGDGNGEGPKRKKKKKKDDDFTVYEINLPTLAFLGLGAFVLLLSVLSPREKGGQEVTFQEFKRDYLEAGRVSKVEITNNTRCNVYLEGSDRVAVWFSVGSVDSLERQLDDAQYDLGLHPRQFVTVQFVTETNWASEMLKLTPHLVILGLWIFAMTKMSGGGIGGMGGMGGKGGGKNPFSVGKSNATLIKADEGTKVAFKDVAGLDEAKVEVVEFVQFLRDPSVFTKLGAKLPKGALLVGPPGTGKTMLAKAVAGEASVPFYSISGSDFIEMFVGVGPARVRDLFEKAREDAPCIIFIDEIDAVGRARSKGGFSGGNDERENTLNQLLVEMDGFNPSDGVVVLAGTNRADILDAALLRPGRFDRQITVDKPDIIGREQIFMVHLEGKKLTDGVDKQHLAKRMASLTPGFAGADIANICNEGALIAARADKDGIDLSDFEKAVDRVIGGLEKPNTIMSPKERELVAYHEAGHAVAGWFLEHADPLLKVTIMPRAGGALGFAQYLPKELSLYQTEQLTDMICMALGGRAAEQIFFGKISTGASDDLKKVTNIAYGKVTVYGMSKKLGNVSFQQEEGDSQFQKPYSNATAELIDEEVSDMVQSCYDRTLLLLEENKALVEALAKKLLEVETISHDAIVEILGDRQYTTPAYLEYVKYSKKKVEATAEELLQDAEVEEGAKTAEAAV